MLRLPAEWSGLGFWMLFGLSVALGTARVTRAAEPPANELAVQLAMVDAALAQRPDDLQKNYQRAQLLAKLGRFDDAYAAARATMGKFDRAGKELAWLAFDSFEVAGHRVLVRFNMGPRERRPPADGIARPLTFQIFNKEGTAIQETFDFEIGYLGGQPLTGCFGQTFPEMHANLGPVDPATSYSELRPAAMKLVAALVAAKP